MPALPATLVVVVAFLLCDSVSCWGALEAERYTALRDTLRFTSPRGILDIGANRGEWSKMVHEIWPQAPQLMIEANRDHAPRLAATGIPYKIAVLGNSSRPVTYYRAPKSTNSGGMKFADTGNGIFREATKHGSKTISVEEQRTMERLDDLVKTVGHGFDILKLDVQGAEMLVLDGAPEVLANAVFVQLELPVKRYNVGSPRWIDMMIYMDNAGYEPYDMLAPYRKKNVLVCQDILFIRKGCPLHRISYQRAQLYVKLGGDDAMRFP